MATIEEHEKEFEELSNLPDTRENRGKLGGLIGHLQGHQEHEYKKESDELVKKIYVLRDSRLGF